MYMDGVALRPHSVHKVPASQSGVYGGDSVGDENSVQPGTGILDNLQQFVILEERESAAIAEESTKTAPSGNEGKAVTQTKNAKEN